MTKLIGQGNRLIYQMDWKSIP